MIDDAARQRDYYAQNAEHYESMHIRSDDEHGIALSAFVGLAQLWNVTSVLDVGAGTGRALLRLQEHLHGVRMTGVEPVRELREVGYRRGLSPEQLIQGNALSLPFADDAFDFVIATGVLHHIATPAVAVAEMVRVARLGVMISDSNKYGQGSRVMRAVKGCVRMLGLWNALTFVLTKGTMSKWSEGDGLFYSYSIFDDIGVVKSKFPRVMVMNTRPMAGTDARSGASHAMLMAT